MDCKDYIEWRGDLSFIQSPCNEIDMSICSYLSILDLEGMFSDSKDSLSIAEISDLYFSQNRSTELGVLQPAKLPEMLKKLAGSVRYSDIRLCDYVVKVNHETNEQFGAVTILLPDKTVCVSFQGTDDTLTGWKEDCNLAIFDKVPAQNDARLYLENAASKYREKIRVCGHSKGGNLAVYAAISVNKRVQNKIKEVYNFDGPGFKEEVLLSDGYSRIRDRITTVLSQHSIVGILMNRPGNVVYVNSNVSGPYAHDVFNWEVKGTAFVRSNGLSSFSSRLDKALNTTIKNMSDDEKHKFVEELFNSLSLKGATTLTELKKMKITDILAVLMSVSGDQKVKGFINSVIKDLTKVK